MSFASNFAMGQKIAQTAMNAFDNSRLGAILSEAEKKPETLNRFSDEDAQSIHDAAAAGQEVVWDEAAGGYAIKQPAPQAEPDTATGAVATPVTTPVATPRPLDAPAAPPAQPASADAAASTTQPTIFKPQTHTEFLGKSTVGALTPEQVAAEKSGYIKGRVAELFDPRLGLKHLREMQSDEREDFKFGLVKTQAAEESKKRKLQEDGDKAEKDFYTTTVSGRVANENAAATQEWQKAVQQWEADQAAGKPVGDKPQEPTLKTVSPLQAASDVTGSMFARMKAGAPVDIKQLAVLQTAVAKAQEDGQIKALNAAQDGAPIADVFKLLKNSGGPSIGIESIVEDRVIPRPDGSTTRVIRYKDPSTGQIETLDTWSSLSMYGQTAARLKAINDNLNARQRQLLTNSQIALNQARTNVSAAQANGTLPARNNGKAVKSQQEERLDQVRTLLKDSKPGVNFSPSAYTDSVRVAEDAVRRNPDADPALVAFAAQEYVIGGGKNIQPRLDFNTGDAVAVFTDERTGKQVKLHAVKPTKEQAAVFKTEVQAFLQQQEAAGKQATGQGGWADALRKAAANPQDANAMQAAVKATAVQALPGIESEMMRRWEAVNAQRAARKQEPLPKPSQADALEWAMRTVQSPQGQSQLLKRLELIRTYGQ